ncbi:MAG: hypothetical protein ABIV06_07370 [Thermoanaerobaculia bacterium]
MRILRRSWELAGLAVYSWIWFRNAWITDDAFITFRSIEQLLVGNGLQFNPHERVQAFTHPAWLGLLLPLRAAGLPLAAAAFVLSWLAVCVALILLWRTFSAQPARAWLCVAAVVGSRVLVDFSSSGLETPLSILLVVVFARLVLLWEEGGGSERGQASRYSVVPIFLVASALLLTRHDHAPLLAPVLALVAVRRWAAVRGRCGAEIALGLSPFLAWSLFSCLYYGSLVPNTALAKLGAGVPRFELFVQGLRYILTTAMWDPLWIPLLIAGAFAAFRCTSAGRALGIGAGLHMIYVTAIGGDFMVGRFWVPSAVTALVLAVTKLPDRAVRASLAGVLAVCIFSPDTALWNSRDHLPASGMSAPGKSGIMDLKGDRPGSEWLADLLHDGWPEPMVDPLGPPKAVGILGRPGFRAHPQQILVDIFALSDPFLARLPYEPPWAIGHLRRHVPEGYLDSLAMGENRLSDPVLAELYDDLRVVVSAPLFDPARLRGAVRLVRRDRVDRLADARCPRLEVGVPGFGGEGVRGTPVLSPSVKVEGRRLLLRGVATLGERARQWQLEVGVEPLPAESRLDCVPASTNAALELAVELLYEDSAHAQVAGANLPSLHLVLAPPDEPQDGQPAQR